MASPTTAPVTVTVAPDATAMSTAVGSMVTAANTVLSDIQQYAGYNAATKVAGPLMGSAVLQNLQNQILGTFAATAGSSTLGNGASVGVTLDNGQINFDQSKFETAFTANPTRCGRPLHRGGQLHPVLADVQRRGQLLLRVAHLPGRELRRHHHQLGHPGHGRRVDAGRWRRQRGGDPDHRGEWA